MLMPSVDWWEFRCECGSEIRFEHFCTPATDDNFFDVYHKGAHMISFIIQNTLKTDAAVLAGSVLEKINYQFENDNSFEDCKLIWKWPN
jgi:hypothetical protein